MPEFTYIDQVKVTQLMIVSAIVRTPEVLVRNIQCPNMVSNLKNMDTNIGHVRHVWKNLKKYKK